MAIEIVDLCTKNSDFPQLCKRLPERNDWKLWLKIKDDDWKWWLDMISD